MQYTVQYTVQEKAPALYIALCARCILTYVPDSDPSWAPVSCLYRELPLQRDLPTGINEVNLDLDLGAKGCCVISGDEQVRSTEIH